MSVPTLFLQSQPVPSLNSAVQTLLLVLRKSSLLPLSNAHPGSP